MSTDLEITIKELLKNLITRLNVCISLVRNNQYRELVEKMVFIIEDFEVLTKGISIINSSNSNQFDIEELNEKLVSILSQLESKDYSYLADLFEFELIPLLDYWDGCIKNG